MIKKAVSLLLSMAVISVMLFSSAFSSVALASADMSLDVRKFDSAAGKYTPVTQANAGDLIYIGVTLTPVSALGGITFTLEYDEALFTLDKAKSFSTIVDSKSEMFVTANNGKITVAWDTLSKDTAVSGVVFYVALRISGAVAKDTVCTFPTAIVEMFDGSSNQTTINGTVKNTPQVTLVTTQLPQELLDLAASLANLTYNPNNDPSLGKDSLADIEACEELYSTLNPQQQISFKNNYATLYENLSTARTRYYRLAESEAERLAREEVENFKKKFADVLALTVDTVQLSDKAAVDEAYNWMQELLSPQAKVLLDDQTKQHLTDLYNMVAELAADEAAKEEALQAAQEYLDTYGYLFTDVYLASFHAAYAEDAPRVMEAELMYSLLPQLAQDMLTKEYAILQQLLDLIDQYTAEDAELAELLEKVADFQNAYKYVYTLNAGNVSIADQSAIQMVIDAFNALDDEEEAELKARLQPKITQLQNLLQIIETMNNSKPDDDDNGSGNVTPPSNDNNGNNSGNNGGNNNGAVTPPDNSGAVQTITKWLNRNFMVESGLGAPVVVLLIMIGVSVCCLIASAALSEYANNLKKRKDDASEEL